MDSSDIILIIKNGLFDSPGREVDGTVAYSLESDECSFKLFALYS